MAEGIPQLVKIVAAEEVRQTRKRGELMVATTCPSGGSLDIFIEPRLPRPLLLVFGETPVAETLARLGELTGFRCRTVTQAGLATLSVPPTDAWAVVATMGHYDEEALEAALAYPEADVSLVASARRAAAVLEALRGRGADEATLGRIRTPAGRVRAASQEEIALFALAEVVAARHRRSRRPPAAAPEPAAFANDPVCGMVVDVGPGSLSLVHGERTLYFCGDGCRQRFADEPTRWLSSVEA
jgi:xanthine dehydrogenase accessory factor